MVQSLSTKIPVSTIVRGNINWSQYNVLHESVSYVLQPLPYGLDLRTHPGALGNTGLTAYYGLIVIAEANKSDRIVVSGAASVIGIVGSDAKCNWVRQLGADEC